MPPGETDRRRWGRELRAIAAGDTAAHAPIVAAVAHLVAERLGASLPATARLAAVDPVARAALPPLPAGVAVGADLVGAAREAMLDEGDRRRRGAHYTPPRLAEQLAAIALDGLGRRPAVCDPCCGGGAFLLAAARQLEAGGLHRHLIVDELLWGDDLDPLAVAATEAALALWSGRCPPPGRLELADGCTAGSPRFDAVLGNPPFLSQLARRTARSAEEARRARDAFGAIAGPYTDAAALFLVAAVSRCRAGGRVVLVQPQSVLAARDAAGARRAVTERAALEGLWVAGEPVFDAAVRVCAPVLRIGVAQPAAVRRWSGAEVSRQPSVRVDPASVGSWPTWSRLLAGRSVPPAARRTGRTLGELATATAGFRDQFYGLAPHVVDDESGPGPLMITSGLVEPAAVAWGRRRARLAGRTFLHPRLDLAGFRAVAPPALAQWVEDRLVPKVVVATQTRVVEAAVDTGGEWVPSTPVIAVHAPPERLWLVAAALLAPPVTAWAVDRFGGAALSDDAVKLSARQVLEVPLPVDDGAWTAAAELLAELGSAGVAAAGRLLTLAHGMTGDDAEVLLRWWSARLPFPGDGARCG